MCFCALAQVAESTHVLSVVASLPLPELQKRGAPFFKNLNLFFFFFISIRSSRVIFFLDLPVFVIPQQSHCITSHLDAVVYSLFRMELGGTKSIYGNPVCKDFLTKDQFALVRQCINGFDF